MRITKAWGTQGSEEIKSDAIGSVDDIPWSGDMRWAYRSNSAPATENAAAFTLKPVAFSSSGSNRPQDWGAKPARRCRVRGSEEEESFSNCTHSIIQILFFKRTYVVNKNMAEKEHGSEPFTLPAFHILSHSVMAKGRMTIWDGSYSVSFHRLHRSMVLPRILNVSQMSTGVIWPLEEIGWNGREIDK